MKHLKLIGEGLTEEQLKKIEEFCELWEVEKYVYRITFERLCYGIGMEETEAYKEFKQKIKNVSS